MMDTDAHARTADASLPAFSTYPPAPWQARGRCWAGLFRADAPATLPAGLKPLLDPSWRVVALVRYEPGSTLCYDELLVGPLARHRLRCGIYVEHIYVDSTPSLWGGREIWGLPKRLAAFTWRDGRCNIADDEGIIAVARVDTRPAHLPLYAPFIALAFGQLEVGLAQLVAPGIAHLGRAEMRLEEWSPRFAFRLSARPVLSIAAKPFRVRFPAPSLIQ